MAGERSDDPALTALGLAGPVPADAPLVSVLICTFNRRAWLAEAVASVRRQSWPVEVIVVDDGSTDDTAAWLDAQPGVHWVRHAENRGKPAALETGMGLVRGEAVLVLDDDDLLLPNSVRALAHALFADESLVATIGDTAVFDDATGAFVDVREATRLPGAWARRAALTVIPAMPGATLVRMSAQVQLAPFEPSLVRGQDMDHYLRLAELGPWGLVPLPVQLYRRHDGLRGAAGARWHKHKDPTEHRRRFLACVQPVFARRWAAAVPDRAEGFAWALGLAQRELSDEAKVELDRWPGPWTAHEAWVRQKVGLPASAAPVTAAERAELLVDDGDDGALLELLAAVAPRGPVEVVTACADPALGAAQAFFPGTYRVESRLGARSGVRRLRLSSDPTWSSPPVDAALLPPLPPGDAVLALAAALDWPLPLPTRRVRNAVAHPLAARCAIARAAPLPRALAAAADVLQAMPDWRPGRALAARLCERAGLTAEAEGLRA